MTNKITLHNTRIINWGLITDSAYTRKNQQENTLVIDNTDHNYIDENLQLIVAANGVGKSTYADALLFNITCTTKFNSSADPNTKDREHRKINTYTRGEHDNVVNRDVDLYPQFLSFIAIDWKVSTSGSSLGNQYFTTLTVIETKDSKSTNHQTKRYILDTKVTDLDYYQADGTQFTSINDFEKANHLTNQSLSTNAYKQLLIQKLNLNIDETSFNDFTKVLHAGYAAKTDKKFDEFVNEYILASNVNRDQITELINNLQLANDLQQKLNIHKRRLQSNEHVVNNYLTPIMETAKYTYQLNAYQAHHQIQRSQTELTNVKRELKLTTTKLDNLNAERQTLAQTVDDLQQEIADLRATIKTSSDPLRQAETTYNRKQELFNDAQAKYQDLVTILSQLSKPLSIDDDHLNDKLHNKLDEIQAKLDKINETLINPRQKLHDKQQQVVENQHMINDLKKQEYPSSNPVVKFRKEFITNNQIDPKHIRLLADFVTEQTTDPQWRKIIEQLLMPHEDTLFIDNDDVFHLAEQQLPKQSHIKLLNKSTVQSDMKQHAFTEPLDNNALLKLITINNRYVEHYLRSKFGKYHTYDDVTDVDPKHQQYTIIKTGLITNQFVTSSINFKPHTPLIAFNNKIDAQQQIDHLQVENQQLQADIQACQAKVDELSTNTKQLDNQRDDYKYAIRQAKSQPAIISHYQQAKRDLSQAKIKLDKAKQDPTIANLQAQLNDKQADYHYYKDNLENLDAQIDELNETKINRERDIQDAQNHVNHATHEFESIKHTLMERNLWKYIDDPSFATMPVKPDNYKNNIDACIDAAYNYLCDPNKQFQASRKSDECELDYLDKKVLTLLQQHDTTQLDINRYKDAINHYNDEHQRLDILRQMNQDKLTDTLNRQNENLLDTILINIVDGVQQNNHLINGLNKQLATMNDNSFNKLFRLQKHNVQSNAYVDLYNQAKAIEQKTATNKEHQAAQKTLIKEINYATAHDEDPTDRLMKLLDCRNYVKYQFQSKKANDDNQKWTSVKGGSVQSGGENQIPLLLIITLALARFYDDQSEDTLTRNAVSARLIILDEAFNKADAKNINFMLNVFKKLNLQPIIIAPNSGNFDLNNKSYSMMELIKNEYDHDQTKTFTWMNNVHHQLS